MKEVFFAFVFLISLTAYSQNIRLREVCTLPSALAETSGLESTNPNQFWTHNDSGGQAALYAFDTLGTITRTLSISNATNTDWEDMARDTNGNLYLGDFGNNNNDRRNLRIYKIPAPATVTGNAVSAGVIQFTYQDQAAFPPADNQKNFDMEAMIFFNDSLYLFSKNRTVPFNGYTKLYRLPAQPGTYTAALVDSFYTGTDAIAGQITAAAISPDSRRLALLSYTRLYVFTEFTSSRFFKGQATILNLEGLSQKEGIAFADNCTLYLTDEEFLGTGRKLYQVDICPVTTGLKGLQPDPGMAISSMYPNPAVSQVAVWYHLPLLLPQAQLLVYNTYGQEVSRTRLYTSEESVVLAVDDWRPGVYFCRIETSTHAGTMYKLAVLR